MEEYSENIKTENIYIITENIKTENINIITENIENINTENTENIDIENDVEDYNSMTGNCEHNDDNFDIIQEECEYCDYCEYCDDCEYIREYYNYLPENDDYLRSYQEDENGDYLD
jgi:hypothetical protein